MAKERLPISKQVYFALGQLGWSILSGLISSYLVYFYLPPGDSGIPLFIPQVAIFGFLTIIGLITMAGRCFDAITDPWIATLSDKSKSPRGRRISFMAKAAVPFAVLTALVFWTPVAYMSYINVIWLAVMLLAYPLHFL
jgi:GPH family glycoside/pentoside/hexuronide:cation symporter